MKVIWTVPAKAYLKEIYLYYYEVAGRKVALSIQKNIMVAAKKLASMVELGLIEPELEHTKFQYRSLIAGNYKIIYRIADGHIYIVDVFDTRQNPEKLGRGK
jgi:plasmid stabilization system protein ParE